MTTSSTPKPNEADDEESQLQRKTPETERRYSLVPRQGYGESAGSSPQWIGGLYEDLWDMSLAYLSVFCSCCVFWWNMSRLGLGNMYVHVAMLLFLAPFFIFDLAAISMDEEAVRYALGLAGIFLCVLGLLYGGVRRTADAYKVELVVQDTLQDKQPMPMHHRHHPTLQEPLRFAGVFVSPTAAAARSVNDGVIVPPSQHKQQ